MSTSEKITIDFICDEERYISIRNYFAHTSVEIEYKLTNSEDPLFLNKGSISLTFPKHQLGLTALMLYHAGYKSGMEVIKNFAL